MVFFLPGKCAQSFVFLSSETVACFSPPLLNMKETQYLADLFLHFLCSDVYMKETSALMYHGKSVSGKLKCVEDPLT